MAHYYDIDDILMEDEIISIVFQVDANGVGMLDTGAETNKVELGTKVEVPFWLAYELYIRIRNAVTVNVPPGFNQKTRKEIQADVGCVNLKSRCSYFDELGCKIAPMIGDRTMGSFLLYAFTSRYKEVIRKAHSTAFVATPKFLTLLTKEETDWKIHILPVFLFTSIIRFNTNNIIAYLSVRSSSIFNDSIQEMACRWGKI